jgi:hypothetical protein
MMSAPIGDRSIVAPGAAEPGRPRVHQPERRRPPQARGAEAEATGWTIGPPAPSVRPPPASATRQLPAGAAEACWSIGAAPEPFP